MNAIELKQVLLNYNESKGYDVSDSGLQETLRWDLPRVYEEIQDSHRWWTNVLVVVKLSGRYIAFYEATTTGDMSAEERGWEFDWNSLHEVKPVEKTVTVYENL